MPTITHIDESLMQVLTESADVALLAGSRIYAVQAPQGVAMPCVVVTRESGLRDIGMHMLGHTGMVRATYTVSCLGQSLMDVRNLSRAVRNLLQFKKTDAIRLATVRTDDDLQEPPNNGEQLPIYRTDLSVDVTYTET